MSAARSPSDGGGSLHGERHPQRPPEQLQFLDRESAQIVGELDRSLLRERVRALPREALDRILPKAMFGGKPAGDGEKGFKNWADFSLLPPYEQVSRYFHIMTYSFATTSEGLTWKLFSPTPPQMKK